ncbi:hypothetical protein [Thioalkalivibrio sp. ALE19]|uniref:hypothetical protein n=1 Tax=Thioalkalivibrio sp. ALE19 TaxID=1266909 RepID=UPI0012DC40C5|nr:hypothetical protein [Thioalkalivibrio sp. ALE19]
MSYEDIVAQFLESAVAEIRGLGEVDGLDLRCQLSGGYDSRVTYGLFLSSGLPTDRYVVESAKGKAADFGVAQELASKHGHRLNTRGVGTAATIDSDEAYQLWKLGNMGSYLPIYSVKHRSTRFALKARGDLWTSTKFYQKSPERITKTIVKSVPDNRGRCVGQDWWDGLADIGVDYRSAEALMLHYSAFRSRFHCGRRWYKNLGHHVLYSPLVSRSLGAAAIESSRKGWGDKRLSMDLLLALGNGLASVRFDARSKAFRNSELRESPFRGGIAISDSRKAVYWGRERAVPQEKMGCGLSDTGLRERLLEEYHLVEREVKRAGILPTRVFKKAVAEQKEGGSLSHGLRMTTLVLFAAFTLGVERY